MPNPTTPRLLSEKVDEIGGEIDEVTKARIRGIDADTRRIDGDTRARLLMVTVITVLFIVLNAAVIFLVWTAFSADISLLKDKLIQNNQRLITENVFMSLIGATVVQVGLTLVAITGYLFPKKL